MDSESRRGRDYIRVVAVATVSAADVAEALATMWQVFRRAAGAGIEGWDMAAAVAEVRPEDPAE